MSDPLAAAVIHAQTQHGLFDLRGQRPIPAVVAVSAPRGVPVTLKMRTGWCQAQRNAVTLAPVVANNTLYILDDSGKITALK